MAEQNIQLVDCTDGDNTPTTPVESSRTPDSHIDILYENQRGWFVFGIPLFSSKALWNFRVDPAPWVDAKFKPSAVNITNAQVPDPSWVWDWKSWYVDMSLDVDEEGWQYSLLFRGSPWHGNHPWFHSFVRRRRWLRRRIKQKIPPKTKESVRERLFGDRFSAGGTTLFRTDTPCTMSALNSSGQVSMDEEVRDTATLMRKLKAAAIDREKIVIINRFIADGGEELHYLAEKVCVFQPRYYPQTNSSRYRPLCRCLSSRIHDVNFSPSSWTHSTLLRVTATSIKHRASLKARLRPVESTTSSKRSKLLMQSARSWNIGAISASWQWKAGLAMQQLNLAGGMRSGRVLMAADRNTLRLRLNLRPKHLNTYTLSDMDRALAITVTWIQVLQCTYFMCNPVDHSIHS